MKTRQHHLALAALAVCASLTMAACGAGPTIAELSADDAVTPIKVFIGLTSGGKSSLAISSVKAAQTARICVIISAKCDNWDDLDSMSGPGDRSYFGIPNFTPVAGARYRVEVTSASSAALERDFSLVRAGGRWKAVFMAADYQDNGEHIVAWDNGRRDLARLLTQRGFDTTNTKHLSRDPDIRQKEATGDGTLAGLETALGDLNPQDDDRCFLFMTSHGTRQSFYVEGDQGITPGAFAALLDKHCGTRPTVAFVSACFSGIMVNQATRTPNRIIFTAASADKTSQGCAPGIKYNLFEECAIQTITNATTFVSWGQAMKGCIEAQDRSDPIFYVGDAVKNLAIDGAGVTGSNGSGPKDLAVAPGATVTAPPTGQPNGVPAATSVLTGARNLTLESSSGPTTLKAVAGSARYLLVDFSAPSCGYCLQFAVLLEKMNQHFAGGVCKAVTLVGPKQLAAWTRNAASKGAPGAANHSYALVGMSHGQALGALEGTAPAGSVPTPTILFLDTQTGQVIEKSVGAMSDAALQNLLGSNCR